MLTAHLNVPEGGAMLEEKTYTLPQLAQELGGAADRQSVLKKLQRRGIAYAAEGRGAKLKITIQSIPDRFPTYCIRELQFAPNSDFEKVRNLFYYCFNDEEFFTYPDERKSAALEECGHHVSRQSIAVYLQKLYDLGLWSKSSQEFVYYFAHGGLYREADKQEYLEAWHDYWGWKEKFGGELQIVCPMILEKYDGFPRKQAVPEANAMEQEAIQTLIALTNESYERAYG